MLQVKRKAHLYHKLFGQCKSLVISVHIYLCEQWSNLFLLILMFTLVYAYYQQTRKQKQLLKWHYTDCLMKPRCHTLTYTTKFKLHK